MGACSSSNYFPILFIHSSIWLCDFRFQILLQNSFFLWHLVIDLSLCPLHQNIGWIFFLYFGKTIFVCITWPYSDIPFFTNIFWFISFYYIVWFICSCRVGLFTFRRAFVRYIFLSSFTCSHSFFISLLYSFHIQILNFFSDFFSGCLFNHQLALLQHRLTCSLWWCCPLG